ncbi:MAG: urea transporter, partial [Thermoproteota archaeon]|nr:urea transporter [Thermoproteota archaeon]
MAIPTFTTGNPILDFFYILFNGISEVPLLSSPVTGILILAGVLLASRKAGMMMVLAGLIGAAMGIMLGADIGLVTFGLFGYNSILTGMAFWSGPFVKANRATLFISIFGAAITAVAWMAFSHFMGDIFSPDERGGLANSVAIPGFTSSFIFTTWAMMYASKRYGHDIWPETPELTAGEKIKDSDNPVQSKPENFKWTPKEFIKATLNGVSQVTFIENWKTGIFWVIGLTLTFELAPFIAGVQDRPWYTNAYTAQWDEFSPLYLGGLMALIGSAVGAALSI